MGRPIIIALASLVGCGPLVVLDEDSDGDSGGSDGDASTEDDGTTTGGVTLPTTAGTVGSDDGVPDPSIGDDFPAPADCWQVQPLFEAPDHVGVLARDQDGDGREELWLAWNEEGPGPGATTIYAIDASGVPLFEHVFEGFLVAMGDIQGDGFEDLVMLVFENGPPRFVWMPGVGSAAFDVPTDLGLELQSYVSGFFDATFDGIADGFRIDEAGLLELLTGDGNGSFSVASELALEPTPEFGFASPVENDDGLAVFSVADGFQGEETCLPTRYHLLSTGGGPMVELAQANALDLGALHAARVDDSGSAALYLDTCVPEDASDTHGVRVNLWEGGPFFTEVYAAEGKRWITVGDFDGDLVPDLAYADVDGDSMNIASGIDTLTFGEPEPSDVAIGDVRRNNVRALDMDGDGRDDVVRGTAISEDGSQLLYERIFLGPC